jgi:hypothetical protein
MDGTGLPPGYFPAAERSSARGRHRFDAFKVQPVGPRWQVRTGNRRERGRHPTFCLEVSARLISGRTIKY